MVRRLDKLPKRKVTVDEILERSDLVESLADIESSDPDNFLIMWVENGEFYWRTNMTKASIVYYVELMKRIVYEDDNS